LLKRMAMTTQSQRTRPAELVRTEARALLELAMRLDGPMQAAFVRATELVVEAAAHGNRVILMGMGKSGLIARKIAATLSSTGTPAHFLHPAEALHGDLGIVTDGDVMIALSASGETDELLALLPALQRMGNRLISLCGSPVSTLVQASEVYLDASVCAEACAMSGIHDLAPTVSTTVMLALGDALAIAVSQQKGFRAEDFADLHPGGKLGRKLARVRELMHVGDAVPRVGAATPMPAVIYEMSRKGLGMTTVTDGQILVGIMSDGDLRRLLEAKGPDALGMTAGVAMNGTPKTIGPDEFAAKALSMMEEKKITSLVVVEGGGVVTGVLHLHDLWGLELI